MPTIDYPVQNVKYYAVNNVYLRADDDSVNQYCTEQGLTLVSYEREQQRFSNDGGLAYQYWDTSESVWKTEFGFSQIVTQLVYS
jgi:hypothetical protein